MTSSAQPSTLGTRRRRGSGVSNWVDRNIKWLFTAPAIVFVALLIIFPIGYTVFLSFTDSASSVTRPFDFVGFENYVAWLTDFERFWPAVGARDTSRLSPSFSNSASASPSPSCFARRSVGRALFASSSSCRSSQPPSP